MAVRIRMKKLGRRHRPFFRVCAVDSRVPRDGRVLEELGTYDPMVPDVDARAVLKGERIKHWLSVGALPSDKVKVLIKKYGLEGTHVEQQKAALDRLAQQRRRRPGAASAVSSEAPSEDTPPAEQAETAEAQPPAAESQPDAEPSGE